MRTLVHDAKADPEEAMHELGIELSPLEELRQLDALVLAVSHDEYRDIPLAELKNWFADPDKALIIDVKCFFDRKDMDAENIAYWRL